MSKPKHTPGPWVVNKMDNGYGFSVDASSGRLIGSIASRGAGVMGQSAQAKANARLIAAAPELLSMLKRVVDGGEAPSETEVCNLIAKAEGAQ